MLFNREIQRTHVTVGWIDNFSKCYAVALQGVSSGAFRDCNWTGQAFRVYDGPPVDTHMSIQGQQPGMPQELFARDVTSQVLDRCGKICAHRWNYLKPSIVREFKVNNVPLKPDADPHRDPELYAKLAMCRDGLTGFHPTNMLDENVGSNRGLLQVLKKIQADYDAENDLKFRFLTCDVNIFSRIIKVGH